MKPDAGPVFVERQTYRRRRMIDAARLLPVLGVILVCIPLLWKGTPEGLSKTTYAMFYFFAVWILLAVLSAVISRYLKTDVSNEQLPGER